MEIHTIGIDYQWKGSLTIPVNDPSKIIASTVVTT